MPTNKFQKLVDEYFRVMLQGIGLMRLRHVNTLYNL